MNVAPISTKLPDDASCNMRENDSLLPILKAIGRYGLLQEEYGIKISIEITVQMFGELENFASTPHTFNHLARQNRQFPFILKEPRFCTNSNIHPNIFLFKSRYPTRYRQHLFCSLCYSEWHPALLPATDNNSNTIINLICEL